MKKTRFLALVLAAALLCAVLSGCMADSLEVSINRDGSGTLTGYIGFTEEGLEMAKEYGEVSQSDLQGLMPFEYRGTTYYGMVMDAPFASIEEFNAVFSEAAAYVSDVAEDQNVTADFTLSKKADGGLRLSGKVTSQEIEADEMGIMEMLLEDMIVSFNFTFADPVKQVSGATQGVTVSGKTVSIDFLKIGLGGSYVFETTFSPAPETGIAHAADLTVELDGKPVKFQAYALIDAAGGVTNYIKLRDVAYMLNGTKAQFEVGWDGQVNVTTAKSYTANGSEMKTPFSGDRKYTMVTAETMVNGVGSAVEAIMLTDDAGGGYTYYKLRDLGKYLGFNVGWSAERGVYLETDKAYIG